MDILSYYEHLCDEVDSLSFSWPVERIYNPLRYAWDGFRTYIERYCSGHKRVIFLGMNPGPWGMAQTGIPFGEVGSVKQFLGINALRITPPDNQHPSYPVTGLECSRSEVSGRRLWGLFWERYGTAESFFREHIVLNYCPLLFLVEGSRTLRNLTPDKLRKAERDRLFALCDVCLQCVASALEPEYVVGVGKFAADRAVEVLGGEVVRILHPSPASPASNHDWSEKVTEQLVASGVWGE